MAIVSEDFIRCSACEGADFEKKEIITLPKGLKKRYGNEEANELPILDKKIVYYCATCNSRLDK